MYLLSTFNSALIFSPASAPPKEELATSSSARSMASAMSTIVPPAEPTGTKGAFI